MNGKGTFSPVRKMHHEAAAAHIKMPTCITAFVIRQLPPLHSSALMVLSTHLCHLCRCWKNCCSRYFGTDIGFCSLVELVRSESSPLPGLVWSSAETERDYINVQPLQCLLCNPAGCTSTPTLCAVGHTAHNMRLPSSHILTATAMDLTTCFWRNVY